MHFCLKYFINAKLGESLSKTKTLFKRYGKGETRKSHDQLGPIFDNTKSTPVSGLINDRDKFNLSHCKALNTYPNPT